MKVSWLVVLALVLSVLALPAAADAKIGKIVDDRDLVRTGKWVSKSSADAWNKTLSRSKVKGAKLTTKESTSAGGAVSFQAGPDRGKAQIFVGGVKKATVKTAAAKKKTKVVQFAGTGKVVIKVKSPGKKGVWVDVVALSDVGTPPSTTPHPGAGEVIITEVLAEPTDPTNSEWFELQNVAEDTWNLDGCTVTDGEGTSTLSAPDMPGSNVFVFARSTDTATNGGVTAEGSYTLTLTANDSLTLACGATTIDTITWTTVTEGQTRSLDGNKYSAAQNDLDSAWCLGTAAYGDGGDLGTPHAGNGLCPDMP